MPLIYPTNREIQVIAAEKVARLSANRVGFNVMPIRSVNAHFIDWQQRDNFNGLQQLRGLDGQPAAVRRVGSKRYIYEPGVFGEFLTVTEQELTARAGSIMGDPPIDITDLVLEFQNQLLERELDQAESIIWNLLANGTFTVSALSGIQFNGTFDLQTHTAAVDWSANTAKPIDDFRAAGLKGAGKGVNFGASATAYMNKVTANEMLQHFTNDSSILVNAGSTVINLADVNRILAGNDLPTIQIYDEGYYNDSNVFTRYIPTGVVIIVGARADGSTVGEYRMTRNANNPGMTPGAYTYIKDYASGINAPKETPPRLEVHRGHNGGPVVYFPSAIIRMNVNPAGT
jgi:hypothetical protein